MYRGDNEFDLNFDVHRVWQPFINLGLLLEGKVWPGQLCVVFICLRVETLDRNITSGWKGWGKDEN